MLVNLFLRLKFSCIWSGVVWLLMIVCLLQTTFVGFCIITGWGCRCNYFSEGFWIITKRFKSYFWAYGIEVQIIYSCFGSNVNLECLALFLKSIYLAANPKMIIQLLNNMIITFGSSLPLDKYVMLTINSVFVMLKIIKLFMTST